MENKNSIKSNNTTIPNEILSLLLSTIVKWTRLKKLNVMIRIFMKFFGIIPRWTVDYFRSILASANIQLKAKVGTKLAVQPFNQAGPCSRQFSKVNLSVTNWTLNPLLLNFSLEWLIRKVYLFLLFCAFFFQELIFSEIN